jgi:hypothetical protein
LEQQWHSHHKLVAGYSHAGAAQSAAENAGFYGGTLGYFQYQHADSAKAIVHTKLTSLFDPTSHRLTTQLSYYDNNWVWFGLALYSGQLSNLASGNHPE